MNTVIYLSGNQSSLTSSLKSYMESQGFKSLESTKENLISNIAAEKNLGNTVACVFIVGQSLIVDHITILSLVVSEGTPIIFSEQSSGAISTQTSLGFNFGLFTTVEQEIPDSTNIMYGTDNADNVFKVSGLGKGGTITISENTGWKLLTSDLALHSNTKVLMRLSGNSGLIAASYIKKGDSSAKFTTLGATVIHAGWMYGEVNTKGCQAFLDLVKLCLLDFSRYQVSGFITEFGTNLALSRTVRLYAKKTGDLLASTISSSVDGSYILESPYGEEVSVVCIADSNDENNSQIADKVKPRLIT
ncbi:hypothetical protein E0H89_03450 [Acinetobacter sp. ANC 3781]|uniref:hypothetical protein n=1 Tax=Acinetobacter sp. ANC 3781 TaxID=2529835 RepID=UPI001039D195|nr:hypothetical protein [Acinetobacter sp. ANC 3781]TCB79323.1 hypothetical protein E0H89_03450 [Acinetobacter sp. ANC 3781]